MSPQEFERKLTAILSADVVSYSRLMSEDEAVTVKTLETYKGVMFSFGDGALMVDEMIEFDKGMANTPKRKYEPTSPYVEGGETGRDFIRALDGHGDGKVNHMEWEKNKKSTVYKNKHWAEYNKNMDKYITVD